MDITNATVVLVRVKSMHVRVVGLERSDKRNEHGVDLIISATPNTFELPSGVARTIGLPCGSAYSNIKKPFSIALPLCAALVDRMRSSGTQACVDAGAALLLRFCLRHFNSDGVSGMKQAVRHTLAFGYISLAQLAEGHAKLDMIDFPAECEADWAMADPKSASPFISRLIAAGEIRSSRDMALRGSVEFRGVRVAWPAGLSTVALGRFIDPLSKDCFRLVCYTRSDESGAAGRRYIKSVLSGYINDTIMANHSGRDVLLGFRPLMELARAVAPGYRLETGVDVPSALALMCMQHMNIPQELLYRNMIGCVLSINKVGVHDYTEAMRSISAMYDQWRAGCLAEDARLSDFQERCIELTVLALCSIANSVPYTSDVSSVGGQEIITEWLVIRLDEEKAGDCEDVAALILRLWQSLVMNKDNWVTGLVRYAAQVMDLYMCNINTTWSTECHILAIMTERTCLYHKLALGMHALKDQPYMNADLHNRCMRGIEHTVFWDDFMYHSGSSRAKNKKHCYDSRHRRRWPSFLPPVYYAEGTRVCPPDNRSMDIRICRDQTEHHMRVAQRQVAMEFMAQLTDEQAPHVRKLEPRLAGPSMVTQAQLSQDPMILSDFYQCFISMSFTPPPLVYLMKLVWECRGGQCDVSVVERMLQDDIYFLYAMFHDRSSPMTFGVHHSWVANNDRRCALIPFGQPTMELLRAFASVLGCEPPVLAPRAPVDLHDKGPDAVGIPEPMPQLLRDPLLRSLTERYHSVEGRPGVKCVRFFPHDSAIAPAVIRSAVECMGSNVLALRGRRCKLAASGSGTTALDDDARKRLDHFLRLNNMQDHDICEYGDVMDSVLDEDVRHSMGALYRGAPLCLNVLDVYVSDIS